MIKKSLMAAVIALTLGGTHAQATVLYDNAPDLSANQNGDCVYSTACGPTYNVTYAAQSVTFAGAVTVNQIDWNAIVMGAVATGGNWAIYADNAGAPGAQLASGTALNFSSAAGATGLAFSTTEYTMGITPVNLDAGTYYFAIQAITSSPSDYLSQGVATTGAWELFNGGWVAGYGGAGLEISSIALTLENVAGGTPVPEPASMALLGAGLGLAGLLRRRRAQ